MLAPKIVEAILDGRQPLEMTLPLLIKAFPVEWDRQRLRQSTLVRASV